VTLLWNRGRDLCLAKKKSVLWPTRKAPPKKKKNLGGSRPQFAADKEGQTRHSLGPSNSGGMRPQGGEISPLVIETRKMKKQGLKGLQPDHVRDEARIRSGERSGTEKERGKSKIRREAREQCENRKKDNLGVKN